MDSVTPPAFHGKIGFARRDITPPPGIYFRNWGAAKTDQATGVHRPLLLSVLVFRSLEEKSPPLILIAADLGWFKGSEEKFFIDAVTSTLGVGEANVILTLSHTHAAASFSPGDREKNGGHLISAYIEQIRNAMLDAAREAIASAQPAILECVTGSCDLAKNRDLPDPQRDRILVGWNPALSADDTLLIGRISRPDGSPLATIVNYACHPTTLAWDNQKISPDFVGAMRETLEREIGCPCVFLQGASGELAPGEQYVGDTEVADRHGRKLAYSALAAFAEFPPVGEEMHFEGARESGAPLAIWKTRKRASLPQGVRVRNVIVPISIRAEIPSAEKIRRELENCTDHVLQERLRRKLALREMLGDVSFHDFSHRVWELGDVVFVSSANEPYSSLQAAVRKAVAPRSLFFAGLASGGGGAGYLPPRDLYGKDIYSVWQTPYEAGSLEKVTDELVNALSGRSRL